MTNTVPKFEPGVQKFLDKEEHKEIIEEYQSTTVNLGYKRIRPRFKDPVVKPITIISDKIWERLNMSNFEFVNLMVDAGLADKNGRLIIGVSATPTVKEAVLLMFVHFKEVKIQMRSHIRPKCHIRFDGKRYSFTAADIKPFLEFHFPADVDHIRSVNASDIMKRIMTGLEKNPTRTLQPINIITESNMPGGKSDSKRVRKLYYLNPDITMLTYDELSQIMCCSIHKPHCTYTQFFKLMDDKNKQLEEEIIREQNQEMIEEEQPVVNKESIVQQTPIVKEEGVLLTSECDDQIINIKSLTRDMNPGDTIEITIKYTKSSVGE